MSFKEQELTQEEIKSAIEKRIPYIRQSSFECKKCGECCKDNIVELYLNDIFRISAKMGIDANDFVKQYCIKRKININDFEQQYYINIPTIKVGEVFVFDNKNAACHFHDNLKGCTINDVKPIRCREFPLADVKFGSLQAYYDTGRKYEKNFFLKECNIHNYPQETMMIVDYEKIIDAWIWKDRTIEYNKTHPKFSTDTAKKFYENASQLIDNPVFRKKYLQKIRSEMEYGHNLGFR